MTSADWLNQPPDHDWAFDPVARCLRCGVRDRQGYWTVERPDGSWRRFLSLPKCAEAEKARGLEQEVQSRSPVAIRCPAGPEHTIA